MIHWKRSREVKVYKEVGVRLSDVLLEFQSCCWKSWFKLCGETAKIGFGLTVENDSHYSVCRVKYIVVNGFIFARTMFFEDSQKRRQLATFPERPGNSGLFFIRLPSVFNLASGFGHCKSGNISGSQRGQIISKMASDTVV